MENIIEDEFFGSDYKPPVPASGKYTKFESDKTVMLRILSKPIKGWVYWDKVNTNKPIRLRYTDENLAIAKREADKNSKPDDKKPKHFLAFPVWNFGMKRIEICEITQSSIQNALMSLNNDSERGSPTKYNLKITKTGTGVDSKYSVLPGVVIGQLDELPSTILNKETGEKSPSGIEILEIFKKTPINMEALYEGKDPFASVGASSIDAEEVF